MQMSASIPGEVYNASVAQLDRQYHHVWKWSSLVVFHGFGLKHAPFPAQQKW